MGARFEIEPSSQLLGLPYLVQEVVSRGVDDEPLNIRTHGDGGINVCEEDVWGVAEDDLLHFLVRGSALGTELKVRLVPQLVHLRIVVMSKIRVYKLMTDRAE